MKYEIDTKGFQELTEEEAVAVDGGFWQGIVAYWLNISRGIVDDVADEVGRSNIVAERKERIGTGLGIASRVLGRLFNSFNDQAQ